MVDAAMLRPHKDEHNLAETMFFARCTQQEVVFCFWSKSDKCAVVTRASPPAR
jgi:hypothetical protein